MDRRREAGQAVVEFALIGTILLMLTVGVVDAGRAFYQNNAIAAAARYGARWGSVVGGTCNNPPSSPTTDWCTQEGNTSVSGTTFWLQNGNQPAQSGGTSCPTNGNQTGFPYYRVSDYVASTSTSGTPTTIVGAIAQRYDTTSSSSNVIVGLLTPGFELSSLKVCIQLGWDSSTSSWLHDTGDTVTVYVYYAFHPAGPLFSNATINLAASSQYVIE
jgi:hypothetical protein